MSISPPSDIVLDVARAADPTRYAEAAQRLAQLSFAREAGGVSPAVTDAFDSALADVADSAEDMPVDTKTAAPRPIINMPFDTVTALARLRTDTALASGMSVPTVGSSSTEAYRGFEAMFLSNFVESILPKDSGTLFGTGSAGEMWRSMLAQQIAGQLAESGGIGIADQLESSAAAKSAAHAAGSNSTA